MNCASENFFGNGIESEDMKRSSEGGDGGPGSALRSLDSNAVFQLNPMKSAINQRLTGV
jgi:hypothetical protein